MHISTSRCFRKETLINMNLYLWGVFNDTVDFPLLNRVLMMGRETIGEDIFLSPRELFGIFQLHCER